MKFATINSAQLAKHNRWDAAFHIAVKETEASVKDLEAAGVTPPMAIGRLKSLRTVYLEPVTELCYGGRLNARKPTREDLIAAIEKYPLIAYALVLRERDRLVKMAQTELDAAKGMVERLNIL